MANLGVLFLSEKSTISKESSLFKSFLHKESFSECPDLYAWKCPIKGDQEGIYHLMRRGSYDELIHHRIVDL